MHKGHGAGPPQCVHVCSWSCALFTRMETAEITSEEDCHGPAVGHLHFSFGEI